MTSPTFSTQGFAAQSISLSADTLKRLTYSASAHGLADPGAFARAILPGFSHLRRGPMCGGQLIIDVSGTPSNVTRAALVAAVQEIAVVVVDHVGQSGVGRAVAERTLAALTRSDAYAARITDALRRLLPRASASEAEAALERAKQRRAEIARLPRAEKPKYSSIQTAAACALEVLRVWLPTLAPGRHRFGDVYASFAATCAQSRARLEEKHLEAAADIGRNTFYRLLNQEATVSRKANVSYVVIEATETTAPQETLAA